MLLSFLFFVKKKTEQLGFMNLDEKKGKKAFFYLYQQIVGLFYFLDLSCGNALAIDSFSL